MSTLYRYLRLFREGDCQIESLADKSKAPHSHPLWFTDEQKDEVIQYKLQHKERSARQIAKDLAANGRLQISYHSVANILNQHGFSAPVPEQMDDAPQLEPVGVLQAEVPEVPDPIGIVSERVDDIPLLFSIQQQMGIAEVIDEVIVPHGNRCGLSFGWLTTVWLSYILSEADHRMCGVESWAAEHLMTLRRLLPLAACRKDFTDDRLADVLFALSDDLIWEQMENCLGHYKRISC